MQLVETSEALRAVAAQLAQSRVFYLDTEFDSSRDGIRLSLVQVNAGGVVAVIDALRLPDLSPLRAVLCAPQTTWVVHSGQQDVALLLERLELDEPPLVFDTQIAWSLVTIEHAVSLAYLKYRLLGMRSNKGFQADDWLRRPLPEAQLAYAAEDVRELPELHRALAERAEQLGRLEAVFRASREYVRPEPEPVPPLSARAFRNAWQLEREGHAALGFIIDWYNSLPESERRTAPDMKGLFSLAMRRPKNLDEIGRMRAVPRRVATTHGRALVAGIEAAVARAERGEFPLLEPPHYAVAEEVLAEGWLGAARAETCVELGVAPELALPARLMRRMLDAAMRGGDLAAALETLAGWRKDLLAAELAKKLGRFGAFPGRDATGERGHEPR